MEEPMRIIVTRNSDQRILRQIASKPHKWDVVAK